MFKLFIPLFISCLALPGCVSTKPETGKPITHPEIWMKQGDRAWGIWQDDPHPMRSDAKMKLYISFTAPPVAEPRLVIMRGCADSRREITTITYQHTELNQINCNGLVVEPVLSDFVDPTMLHMLQNLPAAPAEGHVAFVWFFDWLKEETK